MLTVIRSLAEELAGAGVSYASFAFNDWSPDSPWGQCCQPLYDRRSFPLADLLSRECFDVLHLVETACTAEFNPRKYLRRAGYTGPVLCMSQNAVSAVADSLDADIYVACSEASRRVMAETIADPIRVIPNAVDLQTFSPVEPTTLPPRPILAWVGRASDGKQKDLAGFLHLAARHWGDEIDFVVIDADNPSDGTACQWLSGRVRHLPRQPTAELVGWYASVRASGGAVVSTSRFEGMSLALIEAAACGCPVIAPRVPGTDHLIDDRTAYLYDRSDGVAGLDACIRRLADVERRQQIAATALAEVRAEHDVRVMASRYLAAYEDCITAARDRQRSLSLSSILWQNLYRGRRMVKQMNRAFKPAAIR